MIAPRTEVSPLSCIYCAETLSPQTRNAHAIPSSLGGRKQSRETECSGCNEYFNRLDGSVSEALRPLSASAGAVTAKGKRIEAAVHGTAEGSLRVWGPIAQRRTRSPEFSFHDEKKTKYVGALPRDDIERASVIAKHLYDDGHTVQDLVDERVRLRYDFGTGGSRRVDPGTFTVRLGGREHGRAFAKMLISLVGCFDGAAARSSYLEPARQFARNDAGSVEFWAENNTFGCGLLTDLPVFAHEFAVWSSQGNLVALVRFFGRLQFTAVLASRWQRAPLAIAYAVDPQGLVPPREASKKGDGPALGLVHPGSLREVTESFSAWFLEMCRRDDAASGARWPALPPDPARLEPLIKKRLHELWAKDRKRKDRPQ